MRAGFTAEPVRTLLVPADGSVTAAQLHEQIRLRFLDNRTAIVDTTPPTSDERFSAAPSDSVVTVALSYEDVRRFAHAQLADQIEHESAALFGTARALFPNRFFNGDPTDPEARLWALAPLVEGVLRGTLSEEEAARKAAESSVLARWKPSQSFLRWVPSVIASLVHRKGSPPVERRPLSSMARYFLHGQRQSLLESLQNASTFAHGEPAGAEKCPLEGFLTPERSEPRTLPARP
jgi:hypothetical protein